MARIRFTPNLRHHLEAPDMQVQGGDVRGLWFSEDAGDNWRAQRFAG
ncbi:MAG: hypothetical protein OXU78_00840 [Deltaproteobacteria bacterium]|nr:hypothetical protein [Deltaproteobacteria bacterium]